MKLFCKTSFLSFVFFFAFASVVSAQKSKPLHRSDFSSLNDSLKVIEPFSKSEIDQLLKKHKINGASIAFIDYNRNGWKRAYGYADAEKTIPIETTTQFQAASISKVYTAIALLTLVENGVFDLDKDIRPDIAAIGIKNDYPDSLITLRSLLRHRAGVGYNKLQGYPRNEALPTIDQVIKGKKPAVNDAIRIVNPPNQSAQYSEGGYVLIEQLINQKIRERTKPNPYASHIDFIAEQLKMRRTSVGSPIDTAAIAYGYSAKGKQLEGKFYNYPENAAAGIWSTPQDMSLLAHEMVAFTNKTSRILSESSSKELVFDGLGVAYDDQKKLIGSFGRNEGYSCQFTFSMNRIYGLVIMTNSEDGGPFIDDVYQLVEAQLQKLKEIYLMQQN